MISKITSMCIASIVLGIVVYEICNHSQKIDNYEKMIDILKQKNYQDSVRLEIEKQINQIENY